MTSGPMRAECRRDRLLRALLAAALLIAAVAAPPRAANAALAPANELAGASADSRVQDGFSDDAVWRIALGPFSKPQRAPLYESQPHSVTPHPAVARIIVAERGATAFGSGTLVDVRDQYGLVVTNWHVVRDARGPIEVTFPGGFRSHARALKVDSNWDLAALVIWRPPIEPVKLAQFPPRPGDVLTIHGYGRGQYRIASGRCTTYYAPRMDFPLEMVELDVEARQGDSGGPIFNRSGELAGVLFGAGSGTTLGSYAPRVSNFLATLAPDIGQVNDQAQVAVADRPAPNVEPPQAQTNSDEMLATYPSSPWSPPDAAARNEKSDPPQTHLALAPPQDVEAAAALPAAETVVRDDWFETLKAGLALVGLAAIAMHLIKAVR